MEHSNWIGDGWVLRVVDSQQVIENDDGLAVGDCCFSPFPTEEEDWPNDHVPWPFHMVKPYKLAPEYFKTNSWRKPILVLMPGRHWYCLDGRTIQNGNYSDHGWSVVGDPTVGTLTVHPSINIGGCYHGWLKNNKLTADCERRRYDPLTGCHIKA